MSIRVYDPNLGAGEWAGLLAQSEFSYHGHSIEYSKLIELNDPYSNKWVFLNINENSLFAGEIKGQTLYSQAKYYAGLIPIETIESIIPALNILLQFVKSRNINRVILSYLEGDPFLDILSKQNCRICTIPGWEKTSILQLKPYQEIWSSVYDAKMRNMVRKSQRHLEFHKIDILDHIQDAVDSTNSKPIRHGILMPDYYRNTDLYRKRQSKIKAILGDQYISFGAFYEGKMVAYINTIRSYHEVIISNLLSNVAYYQYAPNNGLFDYLIRHYSEDSGIRQIMYSFDGTDGVDQFKHSIGFKAVKVMRLLFNVE